MQKREIPKQHTGVSSNTKHIVKLNSNAEAQKLFQCARLNLLNVNSWHRFAGRNSARFTVMDNSGKQTNHSPVAGNYLRIDIRLVPQSTPGEGYEWVIVDSIEEQTFPPLSIFMQVRPSVPPFYNKKEIAHFFSGTATSTFSIEQKGNNVIAQVNGRNEKPNKQVHSLWTKVRNIVIALLAMAGFNKPQWAKLVKGLLKHAYK